MQRIVSNTTTFNQSQWWSLPLPLPKQFGPKVIRWSGEVGVHGVDGGQEAMKAQGGGQSQVMRRTSPQRVAWPVVSQPDQGKGEFFRVLGSGSLANGIRG